MGSKRNCTTAASPVAVRSGTRVTVAQTGDSRAGEPAKIVSNVLDAVPKRRSARAFPVPVVVFAFVVRLAPPARIVPRELLLVVGGVAAAPIKSLLSCSGSHLMSLRISTP